MTMERLLLLPYDLLYMVMGHLDVRGVVSLACTCPRARAVWRSWLCASTDTQQLADDRFMDYATLGSSEGCIVLLEHARCRSRADAYTSWALRLAAENGHARLCGILVFWYEHPADVNASVQAGPTSLYLACQNGHAAVVTLLLAAPGINVNASVPCGTTPLYVACQEGYVAVITRLLAAPGINVNASRLGGETPLYLACQNGHAAVVALLLAAPGIKVNASTSYGRTPLYIACQNGRAAVVALLMAAPGIIPLPS